MAAGLRACQLLSAFNDARESPIAIDRALLNVPVSPIRLTPAP